MEQKKVQSYGNKTTFWLLGTEIMLIKHSSGTSDTL